MALDYQVDFRLDEPTNGTELSRKQAFEDWLGLTALHAIDSLVVESGLEILENVDDDHLSETAQKLASDVLGRMVEHSGDGDSVRVVSRSLPASYEDIINLAKEINDEELMWQEKALCAQTDPDTFFPEKGGSTRAAKRVCLTCDVRGECLEYAVNHDERFGIWGGLSERERRKLKKRP